MAEDGGKEVGGGKVGEAELLGEAGGGVGEQMAAEGLTHALGSVGGCKVAHAAALIYDALGGQLVVGFHHCAVVDREGHGKLLGGGHTLLRRPGAAEHLTVAEVDDLPEYRSVFFKLHQISLRDIALALLMINTMKMVMPTAISM